MVTPVDSFPNLLASSTVCLICNVADACIGCHYSTIDLQNGRYDRTSDAGGTEPSPCAGAPPECSKPVNSSAAPMAACTVLDNVRDNVNPACHDEALKWPDASRGAIAIQRIRNIPMGGAESY